jgi:membrane protease YdiL (CAAX protease family)
LIATVVSSCLYAAGLTYVALRLFDSEHSVFPQDEPAGSARGFRRLTLTYLSCVFLFYFTVGQAIQAQDVLVGIIVSQFLLIAGPNFLYALWMKLPVKEFLGFKKPLNWRSLVAAPFLAPATIAASSALMAVQDLFLPSPKALEEMMISLIIPPGKPIWLVFAAIAVTPGVALILTAVAFGLFHMRTFRFLPTTLLGLSFGYYSWRQNSIYPTIILHGCHNALATAMVVYHLNIMSAQGLLVLAASSAVAIFILRSNQRQSVQA